MAKPPAQYLEIAATLKSAAKVHAVGELAHTYLEVGNVSNMNLAISVAQKRLEIPLTEIEFLKVTEHIRTKDRHEAAMCASDCSRARSA